MPAIVSSALPLDECPLWDLVVTGLMTLWECLGGLGGDRLASVQRNLAQCRM